MGGRDKRAAFATPLRRSCTEARACLLTLRQAAPPAMSLEQYEPSQQREVAEQRWCSARQEPARAQAARNRARSTLGSGSAATTLASSRWHWAPNCMGTGDVGPGGGCACDAAADLGGAFCSPARQWRHAVWEGRSPSQKCRHMQARRQGLEGLGFLGSALPALRPCTRAGWMGSALALRGSGQTPA